MKAFSLLLVYFAFALSVSAQTEGAKGTGVPENRIGIARIQVFASPKGTPISEVARLPLFFGASSEYIQYKRKNLRNQFPPTTGDTIREITSDSLAIFFKQDMYAFAGYDDAGGNTDAKRNMIHDLPTENPMKLAADSILDEAIDIGCFWTFTETPDRKRFIPSILMKMEIYDRKGHTRPEISVNLNPGDIRTAHFREKYGVDYDFVAGIPVETLREGGILGNVIADVYLQALNQLLAKRP